MKAVCFSISLTTFFDFVTWPPFCSITHISKRCPSDKVKENYEANLNVQCYAAIIKL